MVYRANVLNVMIASPSDVIEQLNDIRNIINDWNFSNGYTKSLILMPVGWETHSAPDLGGRPQGIINVRLVDECDLLVGVFWTRLGTPTGAFDSGTVEEISRHVEAGKPAMVYFSNSPVAPQSIDTNEYDRVLKFRNNLYPMGLVDSFNNPDEFRDKFRRHLDIQVNSHPYLKGILERSNSDNRELVTSPEMSAEAEELLLSASDDPNGQIMSFAAIGGRHFQTNNRIFGESGNARSTALWEAALNELVALAYLVPRGVRGEAFQVTNAGYIKSDQIKGK